MLFKPELKLYLQACFFRPKKENLTANPNTSYIDSFGTGALVWSGDTLSSWRKISSEKKLSLSLYFCFLYLSLILAQAELTESPSQKKVGNKRAAIEWTSDLLQCAL